MNSPISTFLRIACAILALCSGLRASAQQYSIDWHKISGGGGTSTGGVYQVSGTIGQPDAGIMSGGNFTLVGGFWGVVAAVQNPEAPFLSVERTATNTVLVSWPATDVDWTLESTAALGTSSSWSEISKPYSAGEKNRFYVEPGPSGNRFYRLRKP